MKWVVASDHDQPNRPLSQEIATNGARAMNWLQDWVHDFDALSALYWLSAAVAWNGSGGIGAPEGPVVLPPAWLHAKALLGTIALQMGQDEEEVDRARAVALIRGIEVANGGWPTVSENTG